MSRRPEKPGEYEFGKHKATMGVEPRWKRGSHRAVVRLA